MKVFLYWLLIQLLGSLVMSSIIVFLLIGNVKGFSDPSLGKVFFITAIYFLHALKFGVFILCMWLLIKRNLTRVGYKSGITLLILSLLILTIIVSFLFNLKNGYIISLIVSYLPLHIIFFHKSLKPKAE
jgi:hypothetical protein